MARLEEELRDAEVGLRQLLGLAEAVGLQAGRGRVRLGEGGDADREVAGRADEAHQVERVVELAGRQVRVGGRVAAQREDVADARVGVAAHEVLELGVRVRSAGQVRHRRQRGVTRDLDDELVRALPGRAAGAIGHRHVGGRERLQLAQRRVQRHVVGLRPGREELERDGLPRCEQLVNPGLRTHAAEGYRPGRRRPRAADDS